MGDAPQQRIRGHLRGGAILSTLLHASILLPFIVVAIIFGNEEAARRAEEVDVTWQAPDPATLPEDLPPIEPTPPEPSSRRRVAAKTKADELPKKPPTPEQPKPPEPEQPKPEPDQPKPELARAKEKAVDLDTDKETEPPPDAKYLAQKNNRVDQETRSTNTNLERATKGDQPKSAPSDRNEPEPGENETKIRQLEDQKSALGRQAPHVTPRRDPALAESQTPPDRRSVLAMRDAERRQHEITPETADPSLPRAPDGELPLPRTAMRGAKPTQGQPGRAADSRLALSGEQFDYIFGREAEAERRLAQTERSKRVGRFTSHLGRMGSALENFIPEVRPGNQTALNTRAAPFAVFLAQMHRKIHELWGFGFLEDLDRKPASHPLNNPNLLTKMEIVLNADGTIDKVGVVRTSGLTQFDAMAVDTVWSAAPYPEPPRAIRSGNGKIYLHWTFHRDERQCATSFAEPYILDNPPPDSDRGAPGPAAFGPPPATGRRLERLERTPRVPTLPHARAEEAAGDGDAAAPAPSAGRGSAHGARNGDPAAQSAAEAFFSAYARGDVRAMLAQAAFPFRTSGSTTLRSSSALEPLLRDWLSEAPARRISSVSVYSSAGLRAAIGQVPAGFTADPDVLFALARVGGDAFVAVMQSSGPRWKVTGLVRL